jgi:hypothetical protein
MRWGWYIPWPVNWYIVDRSSTEGKASREETVQEGTQVLDVDLVVDVGPVLA